MELHQGNNTDQYALRCNVNCWNVMGIVFTDTFLAIFWTHMLFFRCCFSMENAMLTVQHDRKQEGNDETCVAIGFVVENVYEFAFHLIHDSLALQKK